jgi:hypothetical protein
MQFSPGPGEQRITVGIKLYDDICHVIVSPQSLPFFRQPKIAPSLKLARAMICMILISTRFGATRGFRKYSS